MKSITITFNFTDEEKAKGLSIDYNDTSVRDVDEVLKSISYILNTYLGSEDAAAQVKKMLKQKQG
jgi:hypothetical protein